MRDRNALAIPAFGGNLVTSVRDLSPAMLKRLGTLAIDVPGEVAAEMLGINLDGVSVNPDSDKASPERGER